MSKQREDLGALFTLDHAAGPARRIPSAKAASIVEAALAGAQFADGTAPEANGYDDAEDAPTRVELRRFEPPPVASNLPARAPRRGRVLLAAAALMLVGGTAAGAYVWIEKTTPPARLEPRPELVRPRTPSPIVVPEIPEEAPPVALAPVELPELDMPVDKIEGKKRKAPEVVEKEAEDLLARANALRGERRWQDADDVYEDVARRYPRSAAAYVASVASAGLKLDHLGDAARAKKLYQAALAARPTGPLAEEARYGLARALRALGDVAGERQALEAFVAAHPDSPLRKHAQKRLGELGTR
jgi:tetratricopeptide (TPR) repeat protein